MNVGLRLEDWIGQSVTANVYSGDAAFLGVKGFIAPVDPPRVAAGRAMLTSSSLLR